MAKKHIEEEYSVVGIVEDLANTMVLLEHYIPGIQKYLNSALQIDNIQF